MSLEEARRAAEQDPSIANLRALASALAAELRSLDTEAGNSDLTAEQTEWWESLSTERDGVTARIEQAERAERVAGERARWRSLRFGETVDPELDGEDVRGMGPRTLRDKALKAVSRESDPGMASMSAETRDHVARLLRRADKNMNGAHLAQRLLLTENTHYRNGFMKLVTRLSPVLTQDEARALERFEEWRAMSIGTDGSGGFGVPVSIDPTIILTGQGHPNDILGLARVEQITTDEWKGVSSAGVTWKFRAEAAATTDGSPTLLQPTVPTHRADGTIPYSIEVGMDYPGFADEMSTLLREGYVELVVDKLTHGSGSDEPTGIETALDANTNVELATTTAGTISAGDVNRLWAALPIRYRNPAFRDRQAFMTHTGVNAAIQQLGTDAGSAFTVNFTEDGVAVLKGRRCYENDYLDNLPTGTTAANLAIVGDWRNFLVAQRAGMTVELVPHMFDVTNNMPTGERAWFAWARIGSDSINDLGFRMLQNKTS
jgi:HK97 family phage major capsid protein